MVYERPRGAKMYDFNRAREFENEVGTWLPEWRDSRLNATDELDFYVPGAYVEVKEKHQPISDRWPLTCPEPDAFILDELSVRRAMRDSPFKAYFVLRDNPSGARVFLARVDEICAVERTRVQRKGKGKWIIDLSNFRLLQDPKRDLWATIVADQLSMSWKQSACLSVKEVPQV